MASKSKNIAELLNGDVTIDATDIANDAVTTAKIADDAVTSAKLENNVTIAGNFDVSSGTIKLDGNYPVGTSNVALGNLALSSGSLSGGLNTAVGNGVMLANTSGTWRRITVFCNRRN